MTTRQLWNHVQGTILGVTDQSPLANAFKEAGIDSLADLLSLTEDQIMRLGYKDAAGDPQDVPLGHRTKIRALIAYQSHWCHDHNTAQIDWLVHSVDMFNEFRMTLYDPNLPIRVFSPVPSNPSMASPYSTSNTTSSTYSKADQFKKGIK